MEKSDSCKAHHHTVLITCINNMVISHRSTRLGYILHATLVRTLNVVTEWEECIRAKCYICILVKPSSLLLCCKYVRLYLEELLPLTLCMLCKGRPGNRYRRRPAVSYPLYQTCRLKGRQLVASSVSTGAWTSVCGWYQTCRPRQYY